MNEKLRESIILEKDENGNFVNKLKSNLYAKNVKDANKIFFDFSLLHPLRFSQINYSYQFHIKYSSFTDTAFLKK